MSYRGKQLLQHMRKAHNYNNYVVDSILNSIGDCEQILDFGAGYGYFAELLRRKGINNITCVEIDEELNEHCKKLDFVVYEDLRKISDKKFDFIYTLNVLEHIEDDKNVLLLLKSMMKSNSKLFIYVPAFQILYSSFDKEIGHFRRYSKKKLTKFLTDNGFEIINAKYMDCIGFLLALFYKLINKKNGKINAFQIIIFDKFLFPLGKIFDILSGGRLFGKNLIIEARLVQQNI